jgi:hypothetical protein
MPEIRESIDRMKEIQNEIEELLNEALDIYTANGGFREQARSYWYAHILGALRNETEFLGGSMVTLEDAIIEIQEIESEPLHDMDGGYYHSQAPACPICGKEVGTNDDCENCIGFHEAEEWVAERLRTK